MASVPQGPQASGPPAGPSMPLSPLSSPGLVQPGQPGQPPLAPGQLPQLQPPPPYGDDQQQEVYEIDPQVLERPVRIRIDGASRMLTKDILSQVVPFLSQFILNGPLLQQLTSV